MRQQAFSLFRPRSWSQHRTSLALRLVIAGAAVAAIAVAACDDNAPTSEQPPFSATVAAETAENPVDATPSPDGNHIYFIASDNGAPAIFLVDAGGGAQMKIFSGAPLVAPRGIVASTDGKTLYIADPKADNGGALFALSADGQSAPVAVPGTEGTEPTALDLMEGAKGDEIRFTGVDAKGSPAVFKIAASGGTAETLTSGAPLVEPDGIVATNDGYLYITDRAAATGKKSGRVFMFNGEDLRDLGLEFAPGSPTGIAINADQNLALISTLNGDTGQSEVLIMQNTRNVWVQPIDGSTVSGGVHCSRTADLCAWAGPKKVFGVIIGGVFSSSIGGAGD